MSINAIPVNVAISQAYGAIQDDSTADLRDVITEIDSNSKKKEVLREMTQQLAVVRAAVDSGDSSNALQELNKFTGQMQRSPENGGGGYNSKSALYRAAADISDKAGSNANKNWYVNGLKLGNDEGIKAVKAYLDNIETVLKGEMDRHSDISSKLQVEMNTKSSILRRSEKAVSDNESAFQKNADGILRNLKG